MNLRSTGAERARVLLPVHSYPCNTTPLPLRPTYEYWLKSFSSDRNRFLCLYYCPNLRGRRGTDWICSAIRKIFNLLYNNSYNHNAIARKGPTISGCVHTRKIKCVLIFLAGGSEVRNPLFVAQKHPFHILGPSPFPFFTALFLLV